MGIIKKYKKFNKKKFIESIIDENVKISKSYGLFVENEDIKLEKDVFYVIFDSLWDKLIDDNLSQKQYSTYRKIVFDEIKDVFRHKYYREITKNKNVKNMYECHINAIIDSLFMRISNKMFNI